MQGGTKTALQDAPVNISPPPGIFLQGDVVASYRAQGGQLHQLLGDVHKTLDAVISELCI